MIIGGSALAAMACGALVAAGVVLVVAGCCRRSAPPAPASVPSHRLVRAMPRLRGNRWSRRRIGVAIIAGVVVAVLTRIPALGPCVGVSVLLVPGLLTAPRNHEVELLEALDRWIRAVSATLHTGVGVADALRASARSAPALLAPAITRLAGRLDQRWPVTEALGALADECADASVDAVTMALALSAERGGTGGRETLDALAESVQTQLRAWREIEAERERPWVVVRQVSVVTVLVVGLAALTSPEFFAPYASGVGSIVLLGLVALYLGGLATLRALARAPRAERLWLAGPGRAAPAGSTASPSGVTP